MKSNIFVFVFLFALTSCSTKKPIAHPIKRFAVYQFCNLLNTDSELHCIEYLTDSTRVDIVVDDKGMTFFGVLYDQDIQADMVDRDTSLYKESCFEIFFDPGADGLYYYEIEINAKGAIFDFILKDAIGPLNTSENMIPWHIPDSNLEVKLEGTLNDSSDNDLFWSFDLFVPWALVKEGMPQKGSSWAFNFMRIDRDIPDEPLYWVWKPTGTSLIHQPEVWPRINF